MFLPPLRVASLHLTLKDPPGAVEQLCIQSAFTPFFTLNTVHSVHRTAKSTILFYRYIYLYFSFLSSFCMIFVFTFEHGGTITIIGSSPSPWVLFVRLVAQGGCGSAERQGIASGELVGSRVDAPQDGYSGMLLVAPDDRQKKRGWISCPVLLFSISQAVLTTIWV